MIYIIMIAAIGLAGQAGYYCVKVREKFLLKCYHSIPLRIDFAAVNKIK